LLADINQKNKFIQTQSTILNFTIKRGRYVYIKGELGQFIFGLSIIAAIAVGIGFVQYGRFHTSYFILLSFIFAILALLGFSSFEGIQVDHEKKRIRVCASFLWITWGKWFPLENFRCISIAHVGGTYNNGREVSFYKLYLLPVDSYKQQSIELGKSGYRNWLVRRAEKLGKQLKFPVVIKEAPAGASL
jgi:hypothetical protein